MYQDDCNSNARKLLLCVLAAAIHRFSTSCLDPSAAPVCSSPVPACHTCFRLPSSSSTTVMKVRQSDSSKASGSDSSVDLHVLLSEGSSVDVKTHEEKTEKDVAIGIDLTVKGILSPSSSYAAFSSASHSARGRRAVYANLRIRPIAFDT